MKKVYSVALTICFLIFSKNAIALTYSEIDANARQMTEAQFDEYAKTLKGVVIKWTGKVTDVDSNLFGSDYGVNIDMDNTNISDVSFDIDKYTALRLHKRGSYQFMGKIKLVYTLFGGANIQLYAVDINDKSTTNNQSACESGNGESCFKVGILYYEHKKNYIKALEYHKKACKLGNGKGCADVGYIYHVNKQDYVKAAKYHRKACNLNDGEGCVNIGKAYNNGNGIEQNYIKAIEYYKQACELNEATGCALLNKMKDEN